MKLNMIQSIKLELRDREISDFISKFKKFFFLLYPVMTALYASLRNIRIKIDVEEKGFSIHQIDVTLI